MTTVNILFKTLKINSTVGHNVTFTQYKNELSLVGSNEMYSFYSYSLNTVSN